MCGICGIAWRDPSRPVEPGRLARMRATLAHRGPDGEGMERFPGAGLAHRRLAIIDVAGGQQPLCNEDGTVWITFNGEIYNHLEIRRRLAARGHVFQTRSDTEVIVHAYEEYGLEFARHLNGIFALALYDLPRRRLVLARDHLGVKPLFHAVTPEGLFFGSEVKAVLAGSGIPAVPRPEALSEYLVFRYVTGTRSFFSGIDRLAPGHLGIWENGRLAVRPFWSLPTPRAEPSTPAELTEELDERLGIAVRDQMMSEVPLGAFCSGGVDSGLITRYASQASPHRLETFSVSFDDPRWDEGPLASDTAARFGTLHRAITARPDEFQAALPALLHHFDEPVSHPNSVPLHLLSRFARRNVTVVLTGEGSDEVFGGYPRYHVFRLRAALEGRGRMRGALTGAAGRLRGHRARLLREQLALPLADAGVLNSRYNDPAVVAPLLRHGLEGALDERRRLWRAAEVAGDPVATLARYELVTYLGSLLDRIDRVSMAAGLEARVPFLDVRLVEWSTTLPPAARLGLTRNKVVVKQLAARSLSPRIVRGPKSGFGVPLDDWFRGREFAPLVDRLVSRDHPAAEHFHPQALARTVEEHRTGRADHGQLLWQLANVYLWHESHAAAAAVAPEPAELVAG